MIDSSAPCSATPFLSSDRLNLEPLRLDHADEMAVLLDDTLLYTFTGGEPATSEQLRDRYARQIRGFSPDGSERWYNWVVRERSSGAALGYVQATLTEQDAAPKGELARVIGSRYQGRGFAREAAMVLMAWLRQRGVEIILAHIHPQNEASKGVARALGLIPTQTIVDGEIRWQGTVTAVRDRSSRTVAD